MTTRQDEHDLSEVRRDTTNLLSHLLGQAFADRYVDFCHLASGRLSLRVSRPLAAHALREFESSLRQTLAIVIVPPPPASEAEQAKLAQAVEALTQLGFDESATIRAKSALPKRRNHRDEILGIVAWLGLPTNGDVANSWVSLNKIAGRAHERSFHKSLHVDDEFRIAFEEPFELVVRGVTLALQGRYSALMRRVEELVSMHEKGQAISLFEKEIPGALPLQWHFFQRLQTPDWLPHLAKRGLLTPPRANATAHFPFGAWPAGGYLLRMAASHEADSRKQIAAVLRDSHEFKRPEMRFVGMEILAALPSGEAASFATFVAKWLDRDVRNMSMHVPERLLKSFTEGAQTDAALIVARALLQVFEEDGSIGTLYPRNMYEYSLPALVIMLTRTCGVEALDLFIVLLRDAVIADGKLGENYDTDHSHITLGSIASDEYAPHDTYSALVSAVRSSAEILVQRDPSSMRAIVKRLVDASTNIFKRIAIYVLAKDPAAAPDLAHAWLTDVNLVEDSSYKEEYTPLALAWYPSLSHDAQKALLNSIRAIPDRYRDSWQARREQQGQPVSLEDGRMFDALVIRDALWNWRSVLPDEVQAELNETTRRYGEPDSWKHEAAFREEKPTIWVSDFSTLSIDEIVNILKISAPGSERPWGAAATLAHQWRLAVQRDPVKYAKAANQFFDILPIYMDQLFQGLDDAAKNQLDFPWAQVFDLTARAFSNLNSPAGQEDFHVADKSAWIQACHSAGELLKSGLRRGAGFIAFEHAAFVRSLISVLLDRAPLGPEIEDFEERFARDTYLAAAATLRGSAVELCILWLFWLSKNDRSPTATAPHTSLHAFPEITRAFETQMADQSLFGRVPRAVLGRYLGFLFYFGPDWTRGHIEQIFPAADDTLRCASWQAYLLHGGRPVKELYPDLQACYTDELQHLTVHSDRNGNVDFRHKQFGEHVLVLYLRGTLQLDDGAFVQFLRAAPVDLRRHVMWCVGRYLQLPPDQFPQADRSRALEYWKARLAEATTEPSPDSYRKELEAIGHWLNNPQLETSWLLEQLLTMLDGGFIPGLGFNVVEWLSNVCDQDAERSVRILAKMIEDPGCRPDTYMGQHGAIRKILTEGVKSDSPDVIDSVNKTISILSTRGETGFLELERHAGKPAFRSTT